MEGVRRADSTDGLLQNRRFLSASRSCQGFNQGSGMICLTCFRTVTWGEDRSREPFRRLLQRGGDCSLGQGVGHRGVDRQFFKSSGLSRK